MTTGGCPAISGDHPHALCVEIPRLVQLSLLNLARSSQLTAQNPIWLFRDVPLCRRLSLLGRHGQ